MWKAHASKVVQVSPRSDRFVQWRKFDVKARGAATELFRAVLR